VNGHDEYLVCVQIVREAFGQTEHEIKHGVFSVFLRGTSFIRKRRLSE